MHFTYLNGCDSKHVQKFPRLGPLKLKCFSNQGQFTLSVDIDSLEPSKRTSQRTAQSLWQLCASLPSLCLCTFTKESPFQHKHRLENYSFFVTE